jgi:hypothetical protein
MMGCRVQLSLAGYVLLRVVLWALHIADIGLQEDDEQASVYTHGEDLWTSR